MIRDRVAQPQPGDGLARSTHGSLSALASTAYRTPTFLHAWRNFLRVDEQDYGGESRVIAVGPARDGALLELVLVPADAPTRVIHADNARRSFLARLR